MKNSTFKSRSFPQFGFDVPLVAGLILFGTLSCACLAQTNYYYSSFETVQDLDDWTWDGPWEIGVPTSGPGSAYEGTMCASTVLAGNYAENTSGRLASKQISVPPAASNPRLRFWHWFSFGRSDNRSRGNQGRRWQLAKCIAGLQRVEQRRVEHTLD
jgi:hypothetical protein